MEQEKKENIINNGVQLIEEDLNKNSKYYTDEAAKNYKVSLHKIYDDKLSNLVNLMNAAAEEQNKDIEKTLDMKINMLTISPSDFTWAVNMILNTTYTKEDFQTIFQKHIDAAKSDVKKYIEETRLEKRRLSKAEEMRKELDEAKAAFERLRHPKVEEELTLWQKIKKFFTRK